MRHVVFRLEQDRYALPLASVREVVEAPATFTRVPRAPATVRGVMTLRGRVIPVVALARLLGLPAAVPGPGARVLLLDVGRRELGLLVSAVDGVEALERGGPGPRPSPLVQGLARAGDAPVTVLDPAGLDAAIAASVASG